MTITDELRSFIKDPLLGYASQEQHVEQLTAIADRIDAEHERQLEVLYRDMSDAEYVELPVDADGVPIHVGDVMEWPDGKTFDVVGIGDGVLFYIENADGPADWTGASTKHHHHALTVEGVLRDMHAKLDEVTALYVGEAIDSDERDSDEARIFAEYAAKLRLAGSDAE